jgi:hypothetical protein
VKTKSWKWPRTHHQSIAHNWTQTSTQLGTGTTQKWDFQTSPLETMIGIQTDFNHQIRWARLLLLFTHFRASCKAGKTAAGATLMHVLPALLETSVKEPTC